MFGFVVLHYQVPEMTRRCVETLLERFGTECRIAVVDNASPDGSGPVLKREYAADPRVIVLLRRSNGGFARGNNTGYAFLRAEGNCDFIVVMNNDVLIEDAAFTRKVEVIYAQTDFAVCGPDTVNPATGLHQSPMYVGEKRFTGPSREEVETLIRAHEEDVKARGRILRRRAWQRRWARLLGKPCPEFPSTLPPGVIHPEDHPQPEGLIEGAVLSGACYIFSRKFVERRPLCFNPDTFLYVEEEILHFECRRDGLKMVYAPSLQVKHLEDVATNATWRDPEEALLRKNRFILRSLRVLLALMRD